MHTDTIVEFHGGASVGVQETRRTSSGILEVKRQKERTAESAMARVLSHEVLSLEMPPC